MGALHVEFEVEDQGDIKLLKIEGEDLDVLVREVRKGAGIEELLIFERDKGELVDIKGRKAVSVMAHRCKQVEVHVQFEHHTATKAFPPSATVFQVLQWAVSVKEFKLDPNAKAKANLILPGGTEPLPKDLMVGRLIKHHSCSLTLDLTLKDFTNG